jgi:hypothetical protein
MNCLLMSVMLTNSSPALSSERVLYVNKNRTVKQKLISSHEPEMGIDARTD